MAAYDLERLKQRIPGIRLEDNPSLVRQKSRDFYWYSPILKRQLDAVTGDLVVAPASEAELLHVMATCFELNIPLTPRGGGTGNYGQAMPLSGGVVLDLTGLNQVIAVAPGRVVAQAGVILAAIEQATRQHSGQELRLHPSTYATASVGGFVAGGSGGVGSIRWGGLRDRGNIIRLKVATMEATPQVLQLSGDDLHKVAHAYGTNGIIIEAEMPLAPAYAWIDVIVGFSTLTDAASYANALGEQDGILLKNVAVVAAPIAHDMFLRHRKYLRADQHAVIVIVAEQALDALLAFTRRHRRGEVLLRSDALPDSDRKGLPPAFELTWNHTTLRALRQDPAITYLQVLYPYPDQIETVERIHARFDTELPAHLEFVRFDGKIRCFGVPLVRYSGEQRLEELNRAHEDMGALTFNPHRYTLEEGGMKRTDEVQLAFKRRADPQGLLNPGKMIAWDDPSYDYRSGKTYLFPALGAN